MQKHELKELFDQQPRATTSNGREWRQSVCRQRAEAEGFASRCRFHKGYVDSLRIDACFQPEAVERMRAAYAKDVAILPPQHIASIIEAGGFEAPVQFFQAGLIHAWFSRRALRKAT